MGPALLPSFQDSTSTETQTHCRSQYTQAKKARNALQIQVTLGGSDLDPTDTNQGLSLQYSEDPLPFTCLEGTIKVIIY